LNRHFFVPSTLTLEWPPYATKDYESGSGHIARGIYGTGSINWFQLAGSRKARRSRGEIWGTSVPVQEFTPCTSDGILVETLGTVRRIVIMEKRQRLPLPGSDLHSPDPTCPY
jgi:hypothetical protein